MSGWCWQEPNQSLRGIPKTPMHSKWNSFFHFHFDIPGVFGEIPIRQEV